MKHGGNSRPGKMAKFGKNKVVKPKTRKDVRKEKRQLKKVNRKEYFENQSKSAKPSHAKPGKGNQKVKGKQQQKKRPGKPAQDDSADDRDEVDFDDEEIHSSEFGSDSEDDGKKSANPPPPPQRKKAAGTDDPTQRFRTDMAKEKKEQKAMSKGMRKRRIEQLQEENEEEDRLIKKLEKKLKIDHSRADKAVPKCFDDGFDYILEMCLPENINKMYQAAKEADEASDMDDGFAEDLNVATGKEAKKMGLKEKKKQLEDRKQKKKATKLQAVEKKYFDMDSDGEDSEFADDVDSDDNVQELPTKTVRSAKFPKENKEKKAKVQQVVEESPDEGDSDDLSGDEEEDGDDDFSGGSEDEGSDDEPLVDDSGSDIGESVDNDSEEEEEKLTEDIYGRTINKAGNLVEEPKATKYVPPHLRNKDGSGAEDAARNEKLLRLRRLLKGSINRLAEQNLHKIVNEIEQLYMQNSRHDMNESITKLLTDALIGRSLSSERMVLEHCLLIAVLHGNVGTEVGAHFMTDLVKRFDTLAKQLSSLAVDNKELDNVVQLLSHLYTYKVFDCSMVFEMLQRLTVDLGEKGIECVLLVLKAVGFMLRKDDPIALKEFIVEIQKKAQAAPADLRENIRLKFMLDTLMAVKNNNVNKIPNYDDSVSQHLRKVLKTVLGAGKYVSTLKIPMEDLLQSEERGKWWVVGSAWTGKTSASSAVDTKVQKIVNADSISAKLLALAKKQRMSTEDRKNVFCIIMSAEDYIDAFEKLLHLGIKDHKVIVSVLIHCCVSEKTYNPYYSALAQKLCDFDRKYQLGFQYSSWDRIKDIESLKQFQVTNFAKFIAHLIMEGGQPLSILKVVEFGSLDKQTMKLVRQILLTILLKDEETCKNVSLTFESICLFIKTHAYSTLFSSRYL